MFGQFLFQQFCNRHVQLIQTSNVSPLITPSFTAHLCLYPNSHAATNALPQSHDQVDVALSPSASLRRHLRGRGEPPTRAASPFSTTNATSPFSTTNATISQQTRKPVVLMPLPNFTETANEWTQFKLMYDWSTRYYGYDNFMNYQRLLDALWREAYGAGRALMT